MKKETQTNFNRIALFAILLINTVAILSSCVKDDNGIPKVASKGSPKISGVFLLDTAKKVRDSTIIGADPYKLLVIKGENLGNAKTVTFNDYKTDFNPTYNTDNNIIIRIPGEAPTGVKANNTIKVKTEIGETTFSFKIIAKAAVYSTDKITFGADRGDITLKGKNFEDVSSVMLSGTKTEVKIVSRTKDVVGNETMVLRFPTTKISQATLDITNSSGTYITSNYSFVNADEALVVFADSMSAGFGNNSWGDPLIVNSDQVYAGTKSLAKTFAGGNWHMAAFSNWWPSVEYNADYKYFTFAVRGGKNPMSLWITTDAGASSFGNDYVAKNKLTITPQVWNYFKVPLKDIDFWLPGKTMKQFGWRTQGPDKDETLYFDDVMLIK